MFYSKNLKCLRCSPLKKTIINQIHAFGLFLFGIAQLINDFLALAPYRCNFTSCIAERDKNQQSLGIKSTGFIRATKYTILQWATANSSVNLSANPSHMLLFTHIERKSIFYIYLSV